MKPTTARPRNPITAEFPHLLQAPITEAVVDFRVKLPSDFDLNAFRVLREDLRGSFPEMNEMRMVQYGLKVAIGNPDELPSSPVNRETSLHGFSFHSSNGKEIAQFRRDGFTFNRLAPYTSWNTVFETALKLWGHYRATASPSRVTRIATRYINRIELPAKGPMQSYFTIKPQVPRAWNAEPESFLMKFVVKDPDEETKANVAFVPNPDQTSEREAFILDIDAYQEGSFDPGDEGFLKRFEKLRFLKNRIFFGSLTTKGVELFK